MMKKLLILLFCLLPLTVHAAPTERGFTIEYTEPDKTACLPATQLKPVSSPVMCIEGLGNNAEQKTCNATKNQQFSMVEVSPAGSGLFQLKSRTTGLCLRVGSAQGDSIIETGCANAAAGGGGAQDQIFRISPSPSAIQSNSGAGGLCVDVAGASTTDGAKLQSWPCHGGSNQSFSYALDAGGNCPLDDLAGTKIYMDVIGDGVAGTIDTIPPTAKAGGGKISKQFCVPILDDTTATGIEIQVTAFDEAGNESLKSPMIVHPVQGTRDCTLPDTTPPAIPSNFRLTF